MDNLRLLYRGSANFAIRREFAIPFEFTQSRLVIDLSVVRTPKALGNSNYFGVLQPLLFIPSLGFTTTQSQKLKFDKNLIEINNSLAVKYQLVLVPSSKLNVSVNIAIYEPLLNQSVEVVKLNSSNLFIGSL